MRLDSGVGNCCDHTDSRKLKQSGKNLYNNPTQTDLESNPDLRCDYLATKRLSCDTA